MTNTKFRKRALLSSVAMLLVALVALGSATFAWFTSTTKATAKGISIATTKSSELQVAKLNYQFADEVTYNGFATSYVPASSKDGSNWYTSFAAAKTAYNSIGTYTAATGEAKKNAVYDEMLNIKNKGGKTANATITMTGAIDSKFARVAVVPCATAQSAANNAPTITEAAFKANIYGMDSSDSWKPYNGSSGQVADAYTLKGAFNNATIANVTIAPNTVVSYRILVWFEGEDSDCYDLTASNLVIGTTGNELKFEVTAKDN